MELPLIRQGYALPPSPQGEGNIKGGYLYFKQVAAVRYETGDARLRGEGNIKGSYFSFKRPVTVRYETPCGCVTKRAMPASQGEACIIGSN